MVVGRGFAIACAPDKIPSASCISLLPMTILPHDDQTIDVIGQG